MTDINSNTTVPTLHIYNSFQGEGLHMGRPATFIKFGRCNLQCSWCDENFNSYEDTPLGVIQQFCQSDPPLVIFTGGEPMLFFDEIAFLGSEFPLNNKERHIETSGTITPKLGMEKLFHHIVLNFKLSSSNNKHSNPMELFPIWMDFANQTKESRLVELKFVVSTIEDIREVVSLLPKIPRSIPIILQPNDGVPRGVMGSIREQQLRVLDKVLDMRESMPHTHDIRVKPRLHRLLYEGQKGV